MNETFRAQLVHITNNIRPTLEEINNNCFDASECYKIAMKTRADKRVSRRESNSNQCSEIIVQSNSTTLAVTA